MLSKQDQKISSIGAAPAAPLNTSMVSHMFNISGHNVNFVCGLVEKSIDQ